MKLKSIVFVLVLVLQGCFKTGLIEGTKWVYVLSEGSVSFIEFKSDQTYIEYDAEVGEHLYGTYEQIGEHIVLNQKRGEYDYEFQEGSRHKTPKKEFEMIIVNKSELGYVNKFVDGRWENDYFFVRVQ